MTYSPYIPNIDAWKSHFRTIPREHKKFYTISHHTKQLGEHMDPIKIISPTEQDLERAKSNLKRMQNQDMKQKPGQKKKCAKRKQKLIVKKPGSKTKKKKM